MNYYAEAIRIITADGVDYRALVHKIAIENPGAIVRALKAAETEGERAKKKMDKELLSLIREKHLIHAIKRHRELTRAGLKESKEYCEQLRDGRLNA